MISIKTCKGITDKRQKTQTEVIRILRKKSYYTYNVVIAYLYSR